MSAVACGRSRSARTWLISPTTDVFPTPAGPVMINIGTVMRHYRAGFPSLDQALAPRFGSGVTTHESGALA